jgi:isoquinoline 1-oxidoreductase alpha subunit
MKLTLDVNQTPRTLDVDEDTPLLWVLREDLRLTGTRFGCGAALCGACTVHVDGVPTRSCVLPVGEVGARKVTTIEGLGGQHPVQRAWCEGNVPQCGYCQSGQIMSAAALLQKCPRPTSDDIDVAMSGNLCRCGAYPRIKSAIARAAVLAKESP